MAKIAGERSFPSADTTDSADKEQGFKTSSGIVLPEKKNHKRMAYSVPKGIPSQITYDLFAH